MTTIASSVPSASYDAGDELSVSSPASRRGFEHRSSCLRYRTTMTDEIDSVAVRTLAVCDKGTLQLIEANILGQSLARGVSSERPLGSPASRRLI